MYAIRSYYEDFELAGDHLLEGEQLLHRFTSRCQYEQKIRWYSVITSYSIHYTKLYEYENLYTLGAFESIIVNTNRKFYRITSYNVCYTKLLRLLFWCSANDVAHEQNSFVFVLSWTCTSRPITVSNIGKVPSSK